MHAFFCSSSFQHLNQRARLYWSHDWVYEQARPKGKKCSANKNKLFHDIIVIISYLFIFCIIIIIIIINIIIIITIIISSNSTKAFLKIISTKSVL